MNPYFTIIQELNAQAKASFHDNKAQGFWDGDEWFEKDRLSKIALIHSELSEAVEGIRKPGQDDHLPQYPSEWVEMADALERILDYCGGFQIPIGEVWAAKKEFNKTRPYKHDKLL